VRVIEPYNIFEFEARARSDSQWTDQGNPETMLSGLGALTITHPTAELVTPNTCFPHAHAIQDRLRFYFDFRIEMVHFLRFSTPGV